MGNWDESGWPVIYWYRSKQGPTEPHWLLLSQGNSRVSQPGPSQLTEKAGKTSPSHFSAATVKARSRSGRGSLRKQVPVLVQVDRVHVAYDVLLIKKKKYTKHRNVQGRLISRTSSRRRFRGNSAATHDEAGLGYCVVPGLMMLKKAVMGSNSRSNSAAVLFSLFLNDLCNQYQTGGTLGPVVHTRIGREQR